MKICLVSLGFFNGFKIWVLLMRRTAHRPRNLDPGDMANSRSRKPRFELVIIINQHYLLCSVEILIIVWAHSYKHFDLKFIGPIVFRKMASKADILYQKEHIHDNRVPSLVASNVVCFGIACIAVFLRFISRKVAKVKYEADDWFIVAGLVSGAFQAKGL